MGKEIYVAPHTEVMEIETECSSPFLHRTNQGELELLRERILMRLKYCRKAATSGD